MKKSKLLVLAALCVLLCGGTVLAHDYWILPNQFQLEAPGWISFDFTAGHKPFFADENPLQEGFQLEVLQPDGVSKDQPLVFSGMRRAAGDVKLEKTGTYLLSAYSAQESYWTQTDDGKSHNLPKNEVQGKIKKSGMYVKSIKTFVTVGDATDAVLKPCGYAIELVPVQHPGKIKVGQPLQIKVLHNGSPLTAVDLFAVSGEIKAEGTRSNLAAAKTDDQGLASVSFDRAGIWVLYCRYETPTPDNPKADFANYRGYMMLQINP